MAVVRLVLLRCVEPQDEEDVGKDIRDDISSHQFTTVLLILGVEWGQHVI